MGNDRRAKATKKTTKKASKPKAKKKVTKKASKPRTRTKDKK
jgi:hypothetical protein